MATATAIDLASVDFPTFGRLTRIEMELVASVLSQSQLCVSSGSASSSVQELKWNDPEEGKGEPSSGSARGIEVEVPNPSARRAAAAAE